MALPSLATSREDAARPPPAESLPEAQSIGTAEWHSDSLAFTLQFVSPPTGAPPPQGSPPRPGTRRTPAATAAAPASATATSSSAGPAAAPRAAGRGAPRGRLAYCMSKAEEGARDKVLAPAIPAEDGGESGGLGEAEGSALPERRRPETARPRPGPATAERGRERSVSAQRRVEEAAAEEQRQHEDASRVGKFTTVEVALHCFRDELSEIIRQELQASSASLQKYVTGALGKACAEIRKEADVTQIGRQVADNTAWIMNLLDEVIACKKASDVAPVVGAMKLLHTKIQEVQEGMDFAGVRQAVDDARHSVDFGPVLRALAASEEGTVADLGALRADVEGLLERVEADGAKLAEECREAREAQEREFDFVREAFRRLGGQQELDTSEIRRDVQHLCTQQSSEFAVLSDAVSQMRGQQECDVSVIRDDLARSFALQESAASDAMRELGALQARVERDASELRDGVAQIYAKQGQDAADHAEALGRVLSEGETSAAKIRDDLRHLLELEETSASELRDDFKKLTMQHETAASEGREDSRRLHLQRETDHGELRECMRKLAAHASETSDGVTEELERVMGQGQAHFSEISDLLRTFKSQMDTDVADLRDEVRKARTQVDFSPVLDVVRRGVSGVLEEVGEIKHNVDFGPVLRAIEKSKVHVDLAPVTAAVEATRSKLDGDLGNMLREVRKFASDLEPKRIAEVIHSKKLEVDSTEVLHAIHDKRCNADVSEVLQRMSKQDEGRRGDCAQVLEAIRDNRPPPVDLNEVLRAVRNHRPEVDFSEVLEAIRESRPAPVDLSAVLQAIRDLRPSVDLAEVADVLREATQAVREAKEPLEAWQAQRRRGGTEGDAADVAEKIARSKLGGDVASVLEQLHQVRTEMALSPIRSAIAPLRLAIEDERRSANDANPVLDAIRDATRRNSLDLSALLEETRKIKRGVDEARTVDLSPVLKEIRTSMATVRAEVDLSPVLQAIARAPPPRVDNSEVLEAVRRCAAQASIQPVVDAIRNIKVEVDNSQVLDAVAATRMEAFQLKELIFKQGATAPRRVPDMLPSESPPGEGTPPLGGDYCVSPATVLEEIYRLKSEFLPMVRELLAQTSTDVVLEDLRQLHAEVGDLKNLDFSPIVRALRDKAPTVDLSGVLGEIAKVQRDVQQLRSDLVRASQAAAAASGAQRR